MDLSLKNKIAIVTGASKGIGKAIALSLAQEGCRVCVVARTEATLHESRTEIQKLTNTELMTVTGDVGDPILIAAVVKRVQERWGGVDILVHNAGGPPPGSFLEHGEEAWELAINQNFLSAVRFSRALVPDMKLKNWGRIICLTSTIAKEPTPQMVLSASARAALSAFTKAIAVELAPFNITVNTVCPGGVQTDRVESLMQATAKRENRTVDEIRKRSVALIPSGRFASPAEVADVIAFLASEKGSYVTGVSLMVDGGLTKSVF